MKSLTLLLCLILTALTVHAAQPLAVEFAYRPEAVKVWFSPNGGSTAAVVREIDRAKTSIYVQAYSFTSVPISNALIAANKRGIKVLIILDRGQRYGKNGQADEALAGGIQVWADCKHAIAHNKVMIIDTTIVLTGSFNFSAAAEDSNAENLLYIRDPELAAMYLTNWYKHMEHSEPFIKPL